MLGQLKARTCPEVETAPHGDQQNLINGDAEQIVDKTEFNYLLVSLCSLK